ncbi:ORF6N domain-containing protein [Parabacteroides distasonis]|uniref:ORF6N domain-containing protein n=1 Tax=Parabacteroides distasonis TaxID=823 RepID=UPI001C3D0D00|nr:ORF6N domain-containing protein [Parabacteroides distasonis]MCR1855301.1 ORF6N domain-containing protein [Parabacteroides distasonis]
MELQTIQNKIYEIRGQKVMLDFDLAEMYGTETAQLKRAVRRNIERFEGDDFMFELTKEELSRCQFGILNKGRGSNFKYKPFAFTELGVAMLIMRAFVAIRNYTLQTITSSIEIKELQERIKSLEMANEETLCAINDLSEDTQKSLDDIYIALSELATKKKNNAKRPKIGYIK